MLYFLIMFLSYTFGTWFKCILNILNKKSPESLREKMQFCVFPPALPTLGREALFHNVEINSVTFFTEF